ncbi:BON domain-containing protein [Tateyamaria sp.]|uniref:BON domain-containing protein n=1 Tax=Tateyamaria sp. TaxID=1929288 RepID=UPI0032DD207E
MSGEVDSKQAKRHAEDCADACSGVEHVQNNLRVRKSQTNAATEDATTASEV